MGAVARPELKVAHEEEAQAQQSVVTHRLPPLEVARASLVVLGVLISAYLLWRVRDVLFLLMLAILLATAIEPIVHRLRRGPFTRGTGVLVVYTAIVLAIGVPAYTIAPSVASQSVAFINDMPDRLERLRPYALDLQPRQVATAAVAGIDRLIDAVRSPAAPPQEQIVAAGETAAHTLVSFLTVFVLAFYWIVERAQIKSALLRAVRPERRRDVNSVWFEVEEKLGGWVRGQLILMLAIGLMAGIGYTVIGLPSPILLAVAAGLFEVVPMIGPFLAFAPAVLVGLAIDPTRALIVAGYALIIQQIESNVLVPRVMGRTLGVSPLTVLLGILVGSSLAGLPGALLAVPIAALIQVVLAHTTRTEDPSQAEVHRKPVATIQHGHG